MFKKISEIFRKHLYFIFLSFIYFYSRLYILNSDYNIFGPNEVFSQQIANTIHHFSIYPYLVRLVSIFINSNNILLPQRLVSIFCGYFLGLLVYLLSRRLIISGNILSKINFFKTKKDVNQFLPVFTVLFFWLNPYIFYYSKIGEPTIFSLFLLILAYYLFSLKNYQKLSLAVFILAVLSNFNLIIFSLSFYLLYLDKKASFKKQLLFFLIPSIFITIQDFSYANLIIIITLFSILFIYYLFQIHFILPIISIVFFLPMTFKAYTSTIHTNLLDIKSKLAGYQQYYRYPVFTTFNQRELSAFFDQEIKWFDFSSLKNGGLLITDDINSLNLDSKFKENAYLLYQTAVSQNIQIYSSANSYSYFPYNYDRNTYRLYLILSQEDSQKIYQNIE